MNLCDFQEIRGTRISRAVGAADKIEALSNLDFRSLKARKARRRQGFGIQAGKRGKQMIKKVAGGYKVLSENGKNLGGPYKTKKEAEKRLKQVEYFKHSK